MAQLLTKINCPNPSHEDITASCAVYDDGHGYCFGCNSFFAKLEGAYTDTSRVMRVTPKEDIDATIKYIEKLQKTIIRGLEFPYDNTGYYIVWPDKSYYKLRVWDHPNSKSRYISPRGHTYNPMWIEGGPSAQKAPLIVIEGEINALSFSKVALNNIISPGSASELSKLERLLHVEAWQMYGEYGIIVFVDNDPPGVAGALSFKETMFLSGLDVRLYTLDRDFNDLLVTGGASAIRQKIESLDLSIQVPGCVRL